MKFVAALALSMVVLGVVIALTLGATAVGGLLTGQDPSYANFGVDARGLIIMTALQVIMAAGFGALAAQTAVAVGAFLVAPTLWTAIGPLVFGDERAMAGCVLRLRPALLGHSAHRPAADAHRDRDLGGAAHHGRRASGACGVR